MARLPSEQYLIQQVGGEVILFEDGSEQEIARFSLLDSHGHPDGDAVAKAQKTIHDSQELSDEDKVFAHFWSGYFWAHASSG